MSPGLAVLGMSILGTWGLATLGLIVGGIFLLFFPGDPTTDSEGGFSAIGPWVLLVTGLISGGAMMAVVSPLLGLDPPTPIKAKNRIPHTKMKRWASAGRLEDYKDGMPKEIRMRTVRVVIVRMGDSAYALGALCSHVRLPLAGFPGSPIKPMPIQDGCITCPFHGARFEVDSGNVVRQPWSSGWNEEHTFLGRVQSKLIPWPRQAEDTQTYPVNIENGEIMVMLPR
ncbi:MAG: Rieske (2Fe-2S) protein [Dehalococcoidia bacterium]